MNILFSWIQVFKMETYNYIANFNPFDNPRGMSRELYFSHVRGMFPEDLPNNTPALLEVMYWANAWYLNQCIDVARRYDIAIDDLEEEIRFG